MFVGLWLLYSNRSLRHLLRNDYQPRYFWFRPVLLLLQLWLGLVHLTIYRPSSMDLLVGRFVLSVGGVLLVLGLILWHRPYLPHEAWKHQIFVYLSGLTVAVLTTNMVGSMLYIVSEPVPAGLTTTAQALAYTTFVLCILAFVYLPFVYVKSMLDGARREQRKIQTRHRRRSTWAANRAALQLDSPRDSGEVGMSPMAALVESGMGHTDSLTARRRQPTVVAEPSIKLDDEPVVGPNDAVQPDPAPFVSPARRPTEQTFCVQTPDGGVYGPYTASDLLHWVDEGYLSSTSLVGAFDWDSQSVHEYQPILAFYERLLPALFRRLDPEGTGGISVSRLLASFRRLGRPELSQDMSRQLAVYHAIDTNSDGVVSEEEFRAALRSVPDACFLAWLVRQLADCELLGEFAGGPVQPWCHRADCVEQPQPLHACDASVAVGDDVGLCGPA